MPAHPKKERLDLLLVARGLAPSREQARRTIMAGEVRVGDARPTKPGTRFPVDAPLAVAAPRLYVGRGGHKIAAALDHFALDPAGRVCLDIGASTGGFTDCLLQRGAAKVYAVDVGHGQLAWRLRADPRVIVREKTNARHLTRADIPDPVTLATVDVSFISLTLILPAARDLLTPDGVLVCLIKPQFELDRAAVGKGGIVRDPALHRAAVAKIEQFVAAAFGHPWTGCIPSPILGADGNREFLACIPR